jgi:hypothetical protein
MTKVKATGDCYDAALKYAAYEVPEEDRHRYRVVHGYPTGQGKIEGIVHGHAWVERSEPMELGPGLGQWKDDIVYVIDKSNGKDIEWPKGLYYVIGRIDPARCQYYEVSEALALAVKHGHWGPWEQEG